MRFAADASQAGRSVPCPRCAKPVSVPATPKPAAAGPAGPRYKVAKPPNPYRRPSDADKPPPIRVPLEIDELEVIEDPAPAPAPSSASTMTPTEAPELLSVPDPLATEPAAPTSAQPAPAPAALAAMLSDVPEGERPQEYDLKPPVRTAPIVLGRAERTWDRPVAAALALVGLDLMALVSYAIYRYAPRLGSLGFEPAAQLPAPPQAASGHTGGRPEVVQERPRPRPSYVNPNHQAPPNDQRTAPMVQANPGQSPLPPWQQPNPNRTWVPPQAVNPNPTRHIAPDPNAGATPRVQPARRSTSARLRRRSPTCAPAASPSCR